MPNIDFWYVLAAVVKSAIVIFLLLTVFAFMTVIERRVLARLQGRLGPNRIGPFGSLQPLADALKMAFKEQIIPTQAFKLVYVIAPVISVVVALSAFAVIPIGNSWGGTSHPSIWDPLIGDINVGLLWILSISSLAVYGIVLGGWSSGNRYSLLGALRSAAQIISYETSLGLALSGALMWAGTLSMVGIIHEQMASYWFIVVQPLGFLIYLIAAFAEVNRAPFDLPEAEQELTAGYLTEYSGLRWSLYQMSEYINMITVSSVATTVFLGGWSFFGLTDNIPGLSILVYVVKVALFLFFFMWVRATLPRIRYDHLMLFGWQILLPLAVLNIIFTAFCVALQWPWYVNTLFGIAAISVVLIFIQSRGQSLGIRFKEKRANGSLVLPSSMRLAKFEAVSAAPEEAEEVQKQDSEAVQVS
ncbi:MAG TPA: NADH-quinone oxidoreductase subunit NuoH [Ktedonobacteraceae bacterium]